MNASGMTVEEIVSLTGIEKPQALRILAEV